MIVDQFGLLRPGLSAVLEVANELLLLAVHADDGAPAASERLSPVVDVVELSIAFLGLGWILIARFDLFVVNPQGVAQELLEQAGHGARANLDTGFLQFL